MKTILFWLIAVLSMTLTGCSTFDSKPIKPKIIGTGNLHYDAKTGLYFVLIDSVKYSIAEVTVPNSDLLSASKTQKIAPIEGMLVTVFTSPYISETHAVPCKQTGEEIEDIYHSNDPFIAVFYSTLILLVTGLGISKFLSK